jgi:hypothetical protein
VLDQCAAYALTLIGLMTKEMIDLTINLQIATGQYWFAY